MTILQQEFLYYCILAIFGAVGMLLFAYHHQTHG